MKSIIKNLKPYWKSVIAILLLLAIQVYCELSLPQYTSSIIDTGIQNGGIEHIIPEQIRQEDYLLATTFMTESERESWQNAFESAGDSANPDLLVRKDMTHEELNELDSKLIVPIVMIYQMNHMSEEDMAAYGLGNSSGGDGSADIAEMDPALIALTTREKIDEIVDQIGDITLKSMGIAFARECDSKGTIDMDHLQMSYMWRTARTMILVALLATTVAIIVSYIASGVGAGVGRDLRSKVYKNVIGFSNAEIDKFSTASLITRSTNDVQQIQLVSVMFLRMVMFAPLMGLGSIYNVWKTGAGMGWIVALAVLFMMGLILLLVAIAMPKFKIMQDLIDRVNLVSREILTGLSVIRAFGRERAEEERFDEANNNLKRNQLFTNRVMTFMMPMMMLCMYLLVITITWVSAKRIDIGELQVGTMTAFITYAMHIVTSFLVLTALSIVLPRAAVAADRIDEVIKSKSSILDPENPVELVGTSYPVEFDHVSFRYPGADHDVVHDINFVAKPGETTAIIGSTGSGKSTIINLIPRFFDVTEGAVRLGGIDVRDITLKELRSHIGLVPQKGVLFSGTIASNLRFGNKDATDDEIKEAAEIAQAMEFIDDKEEGFESAIAQGGSNVSGGQKQRLAIARAIAKNPDVYIFDDSFSALDMKTDATLRRELASKTDDAVVIVVAQRISSIINADNIIVLDEGEIVGQGTHDELLNSCDVYIQIARSQLSDKELGIGESNKESNSESNREGVR